MSMFFFVQFQVRQLTINIIYMLVAAVKSLVITDRGAGNLPDRSRLITVLLRPVHFRDRLFICSSKAVPVCIFLVPRAVR